MPGQAVESHIARGHGAIAVGHADNRFVEIAVGETGSAQHGTIGRAFETLGDDVTAIII